MFRDCVNSPFFHYSCRFCIHVNGNGTAYVAKQDKLSKQAHEMKYIYIIETAQNKANRTYMKINLSKLG